jgi:hypothetical protein
MPYLNRESREKIYEYGLSELKDYFINIETDEDAVGALNFIAYTLVKARLNKCGLRYHRLNGLIGALECCKQEVYRRLASPYEDEKIKENNDVD